MNINFAIVTPMANEAADFEPFIDAVKQALDNIGLGKVYLVVDHASTDNTLDLCQELSSYDPRFITVWAPQNKNVVDAYLRGYREAYGAGHDIIIEMDAGLSHDPAQLPGFIAQFKEGYE